MDVIDITEDNENNITSNTNNTLMEIPNVSYNLFVILYL